MKDISRVQEELLSAIIEAEVDRANEIVLNWAGMTNFKTAFSELLEPALIKLGDLWTKNRLSLAQAFLASKVAENIFNAAMASNEFSSVLPGSKGSVVIGNIEDDFHSFGRKLVVIFSRLAGWTVHDLGNDVQPAEFVNRALETGSRIIGVSAMIFNTAMNIRRVREEIDNRGLTGKIQLCVGGAVFRLRPGLMNETGADGTAGNAMKAPDLFSEMLKRILQ